MDASASREERKAFNAAFADWSALAPTLEPLLASQVAIFLRWSGANAVAIAEGAESISVDLGEGYGTWEQTVAGPQKYHAKSLAVLRAKFARSVGGGGGAALRALMDRCGCLPALIGTPASAAAQSKL